MPVKLLICGMFVFISVSEWDGDFLEISKISRLDMGAYLCIASNGVGGVAVSKRIKVSVDCKYLYACPYYNLLTNTKSNTKGCC